MVDVSCLNIFFKNMLFSFFKWMSCILVYWKSIIGKVTTPEKEIVQTKLIGMHNLTSVASNFLKFCFLVEF